MYSVAATETHPKATEIRRDHFVRDVRGAIPELCVLQQVDENRSSLEKEAGQVLWDYGTEVTCSLKQLTKTLKKRFGGVYQADKFRIEVRNQRRKEGEAVASLHSDIRRLTALAFPDIDRKARESLALSLIHISEPTRPY